MLKIALLAAASDGEATPGRRNPFGQMYEIRYPCTGPTGTADVLSVWIVEVADPNPRLGADLRDGDVEGG